MAEKYLYQRGGCWYLDFTLPKRMGGKRIRRSLETSDIKTARTVRDKYINPILLSSSAIDALEAVGLQLQKLLSDSEKQIAALKNIRIAEESLYLHEAADKYYDYLPDSGLAKKSMESYQSSIKKIKALFPDCDLTAINKNMAIKALEAMSSGEKALSATRIKFNFQCWRAFLRWCIGRGYAPEGLDQILYIPLPTVKKEHTPTIAPDKADTAMLILKNWSLAPRISRYTGMRLREVLNLNYSDIIEHHGIKCFRLDKTKTGDPRVVPIAKKLLPYIKDFSELAKTGKKNDKYNTEIKKIPGCEKCKFHSWRVYANTQMMEQGVDKAVRMKILGHKNNKNDVHTGYTAVQLSEMKKAVDLIY